MLTTATSPVSASPNWIAAPAFRKLCRVSKVSIRARYIQFYRGIRFKRSVRSSDSTQFDTPGERGPSNGFFNYPSAHLIFVHYPALCRGLLSLPVRQKQGRSPLHSSRAAISEISIGGGDDAFLGTQTSRSCFGDFLNWRCHSIRSAAHAHRRGQAGAGEKSRGSTTAASVACHGGASEAGALPRRSAACAAVGRNPAVRPG